jgi:uncharacterized protein YlxW (UPF0749 family)
MKMAKILFFLLVVATFTTIDSCTSIKSKKQPKEAKNTQKTDEAKARLASLETKIEVPKAPAQNTEIIELRKRIETLQRSENTAKVQMDRIEAKQDLILKQQEEARIKYIESLLIMKEMFLLLKK